MGGGLISWDHTKDGLPAALPAHSATRACKGWTKPQATGVTEAQAREVTGASGHAIPWGQLSDSSRFSGFLVEVGHVPSPSVCVG